MASSKEMGPNDADIVRCFVRTVGGLSSESALPYNAPFEIVVEVEAGSAIFGTGAQFAAGVVVRDLSDCTCLPAPAAGANTPNIGVSDNMSGANWNTQVARFLYTVAAPGPTKENHIWEVLAFLRVNVVNPDMSFCRSDLFIITRP